MKKEKQEQLLEMMKDLFDIGVELGMARQRHLDAAAEEQDLGETANMISNAIAQHINGGTIIPKKDLN